MNATTINGMRMMAETIKTDGQYAVVCGTSLKMMNLTNARAAEYAKYYRGGRAVTMEEAMHLTRICR